MRPSLYEYAGGSEAFLALATAHHARCLNDPELNHPFTHTDGNPQHVERLAAYWAEALGGPPAYTVGFASDESTVIKMHCGNGDLSDLYRRFLGCFVAAMDDALLPDDQEFRAAMQAYMQWAISYQPAFEGHPVPEGLSLPRWTWDGLQA
jgi:hemoglobin